MPRGTTARDMRPKVNRGIVPILSFFGYRGTGNLLNKASAFVPIYVASDIWQQMGWNCIIYLAALSAIDQELNEAARIDGARPPAPDRPRYSARDHGHRAAPRAG